MKTAIKLVLIYFVAQLISAIAVMIPMVIYNIIQSNPVDQVSSLTITFALFLGFIIMGVYLWKAGYICTDKKTWSPVSAAYLLFTALACLAAVFVVEYVTALMPELPDLMEDTFDVLQSGWLGILSITIFGPILEELLFRGAITTALLNRYSPVKAIILSALVFGIFHINPAQVVGAIPFGLLSAWIYYRTASLIPCILMHVLNNSLAVCLELKYPEIEYLRDLFTGNTYFMVLIAAIAVFAGSIFWMKRTTTVNGGL